MKTSASSMVDVFEGILLRRGMLLVLHQQNYQILRSIQNCQLQMILLKNQTLPLL
ncbi:hypothetical protein SLEP1_g12272 [Rubroshorea leprosula]|uniref:Uncharacterized protein n=1 Tax=Rubroshorea leprosula TaxID=152421 RepID=A0AAV5IK01_9ROSI|nr:hypothetical protein SLEP1_g12272 [Rubroshorea leprosula]